MRPEEGAFIGRNRVPAWVRQVSTVSWGFVGLVVAVAIVTTVLGALRTLVIPLVVAGFLAVVFAPAVSWLAERRVPRALGAVLVLVMIALAAVVSILAVVTGIIDQADNLALRFDDVIIEVEELLERSDLSDALDSILNNIESSGSVVGEGLGSTVGTVVGTAGGFLSGLLLGAVLLYYLLKDGPDIVQAAAAREGKERSDQVYRVLNEAADNIRSYMKGRTILAAIQAVLIGIASAVLGVPLAFAIGLVNFIGGYIPYIGGLVGGAFAVLMALSAGGPTLAAVVLVMVLLVSVGLENLLEPKMLGDKLEMHPIIVLFATVIGGLVVGIVGMFLAAPAVAILRSLVRELRASGFFSHPESNHLEESTTVPTIERNKS